jgi:hypothetical protein
MAYVHYGVIPCIRSVRANIGDNGPPLIRYNEGLFAVSEAGSASFISSTMGKCPTHLGPLEGSGHNYGFLQDFATSCHYFPDSLH